MKTRLLKRLRKIGRDKINIISITTSDGIVTGMKVSFYEDSYRGLFSFGDTEEEVKEKACNIFLKNNIELIRKRYGSYSRKSN